MCKKICLGLSLVAGLSGSSLADTAVKVAQAPSPWSAAYENIITGPKFDASTDGSINHFLSFSHKFNDDWSVAVVARMDSDLAEDAKHPNQAGDHYAKVSYPTIFDNDVVKVTGQVRAYFGTSRASYKAGKVAHVQPRIYISSTVDKVDLQYVLIPSIFSYDSAEDGQTVVSQLHVFTADYNFAKEWALNFEVDPGWKHARNGKPTYNDSPIYLGVTKKFTEKNLSVAAYVSSQASRVSEHTSSLLGTISYSM